MPLGIKMRPQGRHRAIEESASKPVVALSPRNTTVNRSGYVYDVGPQGLDQNTSSIGSSTGTDRQTLMQELWEAYIACPWAWVSVQTISRTVTAGGLVTDWIGDDGEGDDDIPAKPANVLALEALLKFVNPSQNCRQLCRNILADLLVFADAYIEVVWTGSQPVALYNQDSPTTTPVSDNHGNVTGYVQVSQYGDRVEFKPHEIIHISLDSARPGVLGISPMQAALHPIMCWLYAMGTGKEAFKKGLPPAIHVDHAAGYGDTKARTWRDKYFARNTGAKNIGAPIQTEGGATVKELQTGKISDVKLGKDDARDEILSTFGVPPAEAGVIESGNIGGGTGDSQHRTFLINTCGPLSELVSEAFTYSLAVAAFGITEWKLKFAEVDYRDSKIIEDIRDQRLRNGAWTLNKYRAAIGEPPVDGGDDAVLVDRQNLVLWRDLAQLSSANIAAKDKTPAPPGGLGADGQQHDDQDDDEQGGSQDQANANQPGLPGGKQGGGKGGKGGKNAKTKQLPGKPAREALRRSQLAAFQESFGRALAAMPVVLESDKPVADQVHDQLSVNFPADAIAWVRDADWSGPHSVPVEQIDTSNRSEWAAAHQQDRVDKARKKLRKRLADGTHPKPVVLVRIPGSDKDEITDGHHRVEAVLQENEPTVWAYVGRVGSKTGDWDTMHSSQLEGAAR